MEQQFEALIASVAGDPASEAMARSQYAFWLGRQGSWQQAAEHFDGAAELAKDAGEDALEAEYRYAAALALQKAPRSKGKAKKAMQRAAKSLEAAGNTGRYAQAQRHQAATDARLGQIDRALKRIQSAKRKSDNDMATIARLSLDEGVYAFLLGQREDAANALSSAQKFAQMAGLSELSTQAKALYSLLLSAPNEGHPLGEQLAMSIMQQDGQSADIQHAMVAFEENRLVDALKLAKQAQQTALNANDMNRYLRYSSSSLLMALIQERHGLDSQAIGTLLTCKKTLERYLGPEVGKSINRTLDALCQRWGPERTENAMRRYRKKMQQQV